MVPVFLTSASGSGLSEVAGEIFTIAGNALTMITENKILLIFFGAGIVGIAISAIRKLKR